MPKQRKRKIANLLEKKMGVQGTVAATSAIGDMFSNAAARQGYGTPSLGQGASYELVRLSYDYWQLITLFRNHWISRRIVEVPAQDMVKAWPRLTSEIEPKDLTRLDRALRKTNTKNNVLTGLTWARLFGGAGGLIAIDGQEDQLDEPLDLDSIKIGGYKGLIPFDRWAGISPTGDVCTDINRPLDFNKPEMYEVRISGGDSFQVHASRLLRFLGPTVPTPELEAQSYWGISVLEPAYESITMLDNVNWNILGLTFRANIMGMKFPDLAALLSGLGSTQAASQQFEQRMSAINHLISNQSLIPLPKDGSIESTQYSFGGLEGIFQLFQLNLAGAAQMPVTRLFGRTYTGLGQTGDGDERIYEEKISTDQATYLVPQLEKLYPVVCMSELGEVPDDLDLICPSIRVLDEKEKAELAKAVADTTTVYLNGGIYSPRRVAMEVKQSSDMTGIGTNLDDDYIQKLSDDVQAEGELGEGLFGGEGAGLGQADSPAKAIKAENKEDNDEPTKEELAKKGKPDKASKKALKEAAGKTKDAAPAYDVLPENLKEGEAVLVNGKLLTVHKVVTGTEDLFGEPTVQVLFKTGEVVAYRPDGDVRAKDEEVEDAPGDKAEVQEKDASAKLVKVGDQYKVVGSKGDLSQLTSSAALAWKIARTNLANSKATDEAAYLKEELARATDALDPVCGKPSWRVCDACNGRLHHGDCGVKLHHDRDCCRERGCIDSSFRHGGTTRGMRAKDEDGYVGAREHLARVKQNVLDAKAEVRRLRAKGFTEATSVSLRLSLSTIKEGEALLKSKATDEDGASSITPLSQSLLDYHALPVRIENRQGAVRSGLTPEGVSWRTIMPADYGFIEGVLGADGDSLDCYVGPSPESSNVYVIDQLDLKGRAFDEHKVMLGYHTEESAKEDYMLGHHLSSKTFGRITSFTMPMFRRWLRLHDMKLPASDHVPAMR